MIKLNWYTLLVLLGGLQGIILLVSLTRLKNKNSAANKYLVVVIVILTLTLLGKAFYDSASTLTVLKILWAGDLIIFLFGPFLYFYFLNIFSAQPIINSKPIIHYIPFMLFLLTMIPLLVLDGEQLRNLTPEIVVYFSIVEPAAILHNGFYLVLCWSIVKKFQREEEEISSVTTGLSFFKMILLICGIVLLVWSVVYILNLLRLPGSEDYLGYYLVWIILPIAVYTLTFYTMNRPEIFQMEVKSSFADSTQANIEDIEMIANKLEILMRLEKPYLDPKLSLPKLAEMIDVKIHLLSTTINKKYDKNFFEFINYYRVEEFKKILQNNESRKLTLLAVAYEAGFNSKTTFNTAFKKVTNYTPREFVRQSINS